MHGKAPSALLIALIFATAMPASATNGFMAMWLPVTPVRAVGVMWSIAVCAFLPARSPTCRRKSSSPCRSFCLRGTGVNRPERLSAVGALVDAVTVAQEKCFLIFFIRKDARYAGIQFNGRALTLNLRVV